MNKFKSKTKEELIERYYIVHDVEVVFYFLGSKSLRTTVDDLMTRDLVFLVASSEFPFRFRGIGSKLITYVRIIY